MADINVERKGPSIWPWIIGLIVLALLIWALTELFDNDDDSVLVTDPAGEQPSMVEPAPEPISPGPMVAALPVAEIAGDPESFEGRTVSGEARVMEVPTDRGFWIEDGGQRLFVILGDRPAEEPLDINPGQTIRITDARVVSASELDLIGGELDADTRTAAEGEAVVLSVDESNIQILQGAGGETTGADEQPL